MKQDVFSKVQLSKAADVMCAFHLGMAGVTSKTAAIAKLARVFGSRAAARRFWTRLMR